MFQRAFGEVEFLDSAQDIPEYLVGRLRQGIGGFQIRAAVGQGHAAELLVKPRLGSYPAPGEVALAKTFPCGGRIKESSVEVENGGFYAADISHCAVIPASISSTSAAAVSLW